MVYVTHKNIAILRINLIEKMLNFIQICLSGWSGELEGVDVLGDAAVEERPQPEVRLHQRNLKKIQIFKDM